MPEPIKIEEVKERVILVGVSEQDGDRGTRCHRYRL